MDSEINWVTVFPTLVASANEIVSNIEITVSLVSETLSVILIDSPSEMKLALLLNMLSASDTDSDIEITVSLVSNAISARDMDSEINWVTFFPTLVSSVR